MTDAEALLATLAELRRLVAACPVCVGKGARPRPMGEPAGLVRCGRCAATRAVIERVAVKAETAGEAA